MFFSVFAGLKWAQLEQLSGCSKRRKLVTTGGKHEEVFTVICFVCFKHAVKVFLH